MRDKVQMYICVQLSVFLHYCLLAGICGEVQAQTIRSNRQTMIKALNLARRAGLNVAEYQDLLAMAPLNQAYENKIEFGRIIDKQLQEMSQHLNQDMTEKANWALYYRHEPAILLVDTTDPRLIDRTVFVYPDGKIETRIDRFKPSKMQEKEPLQFGPTGKERAAIECDYRHDRLSPEAVAILFAQSRDGGLERLALQSSSQSQSGSIYVDYQNQTCQNLLSCRNHAAEALLASCRQIALAPLKK